MESLRGGCCGMRQRWHICSETEENAKKNSKLCAVFLHFCFLPFLIGFFSSLACTFSRVTPGMFIGRVTSFYYARFNSRETSEIGTQTFLNIFYLSESWALQRGICDQLEWEILKSWNSGIRNSMTWKKKEKFKFPRLPNEDTWSFNLVESFLHRACTTKNIFIIIHHYSFLCRFIVLFTSSNYSWTEPWSSHVATAVLFEMEVPSLEPTNNVLTAPRSGMLLRRDAGVRWSNIKSTSCRFVRVQHLLWFHFDELQQRERSHHYTEGRKVHGYQIFSGVYVQRRNKRWTCK